MSNNQYTYTTTPIQDYKTLRDELAMAAMQAMVTGHFSKYGHDDYWPRPAIACEAYELADAMLAARDSKSEKVK